MGSNARAGSIPAPGTASERLEAFLFLNRSNIGRTLLISLHSGYYQLLTLMLIIIGKIRKYAYFC